MGSMAIDTDRGIGFAPLGGLSMDTLLVSCLNIRVKLTARFRNIEMKMVEFG